MSKIFFIFSFLLIVTFPHSQAFADDACEQKCRNGAAVQVDGKCPATGIGNPIIYSCKNPTTHPDLSSGNCLCVPGAPAAATITRTTTTNTTTTNTTTPKLLPTSGSGIPCKEGITTGTGIMTAIGCVPTEPKSLVEGLLKYGIFAAGGIAFVLMLLASLQMITAEGNPETLKNARDKFYSALIGLLLIIFSVLLMQVIGVDILGLPGLKGIENPT